MEVPESQYEENPEMNKVQENEPQIDFLEVSVISEIIQIVEQIDSKCKGQIGEEIVNERIKQLAYSKILCNVYGKDITYLIKAYTNLGIAYLDIEYYEQAQEHLLNAFKLNENLSSDDNLSMKEYQIKILINLSKCYLESKKYDTAQQISERSLLMNKTLFGEDHVSNADIYYILAKIHTKLQNYNVAIENYGNMFKIYDKIYGYDSEKSAKISMEMGQIYELADNIQESIEYYENSYKIWEKIINDNNYEILFQISMKLSELHASNKNYEASYEILVKTEKEYGDKIKRSLKDRVVYQRCRIKACELSKDIAILLQENLKLEDILNESNENQKTLAKTCVRIGSIYLENKEKEKALDYFKKAENIFIVNGDNKCASEIHQKMIEIQKKDDLDQEESVDLNKKES